VILPRALVDQTTGGGRAESTTSITLAAATRATLRSSFEQVCSELDLDLVVAVGRAIDAPDPRERMYNALYELLRVERGGTA